ncbi:hypothetical protein DL770_007123 [Monosporascus sp. CRB-9-2]|nr:hypothetical protein DL770_007123 [Monosporascus sp. CRB-9-2]
MNHLWLLASLPAFFDLALGACECGYAISNKNEKVVFTDLLESDFVHLDIKDRSGEYGKYGWAAQVFNKSMHDARGPYGEAFTLQNVVSNNIADTRVFNEPGEKGGEAGAHLVVGSEIVDGMVTTSEIATTDLHFFYGTFRAAIKVTEVAGTCSAFFWYFNDTQEIDIEFLSAQFNKDNGTFPVNLVLQSSESSEAGFDASNTKDFKRVNLPFDPTADFHEYRFDYLEKEVIFCADGKELARMTGSSVPTEPGHLLLSHWSNGNPGWSRGPPKTDATMIVSYVKAYFNSSLDSRQADFVSRCTDPAAEGTVCDVPDNDSTYFFTYQQNMTNNQTTYLDDENAAGYVGLWWSFMLGATLASSAWAIGL